MAKYFDYQRKEISYQAWVAARTIDTNRVPYKRFITINGAPIGGFDCYVVWYGIEFHNFGIIIHAGNNSTKVIEVQEGFDKACKIIGKEANKSFQLHSLPLLSLHEMGLDPQLKLSYPTSFKEEETKEKQYKCLLCGGEMAKRDGKFGPFYSCSMWPKTKCPATLSEDGVPSKKTKEWIKYKKKFDKIPPLESSPAKPFLVYDTEGTPFPSLAAIVNQPFAPSKILMSPEQWESYQIPEEITYSLKDFHEPAKTKAAIGGHQKKSKQQKEDATPKEFNVLDDIEV